MADHKVEDTVTVRSSHGASESSLERVQGFWEKNSKIITGIAVALILVIAGWYAYKTYIVEPKEETAAEAMFKAEEYFRTDSLSKALNGDGINKGFLSILKNYDGTKSAGLAHFYTGIIYLKTGEFNKAVEHLKDFSTDAKQVQMIAYGRLADAYSELGKKDEAVEYYKKAGTEFPEDDFNSSEFLFRAGYLLESINKNDDALAVYKQIKEKYPRTEKGFSIDKYIYRLSVEKNEFSVK